MWRHRDSDLAANAQPQSRRPLAQPRFAKNAGRRRNRATGPIPRVAKPAIPRITAASFSKAIHRSPAMSRHLGHVATWLPNEPIWNLEHEYVHSLDSRFNLYGDIGDSRIDTHKTLWWMEGLAEYLSRRDDNERAIAFGRASRLHSKKCSRRPARAAWIACIAGPIWRCAFCSSGIRQWLPKWLAICAPEITTAT